MKKDYDLVFLINSHKGSFKNKIELLKFEKCGCFYCRKMFYSKEISEWIFDGILGEETAQCPKCGIDSVLSEKYPISDPIFLDKMFKYFFS